jgi:hypothetical protein
MTHDTTTHVHDPDPPAKKRPSNLGRKLARWTSEEVDKLHALYNKGVRRYDIAKELKMPEERVRQRLQWESKAGTLLEIRKRRRAAQRLVTKEEQKSERVFFDKVQAGPRPTQEALKERDERYLAPARNIAGLLFGDPPVGFSALERRV